MRTEFLPSLIIMPDDLRLHVGIFPKEIIQQKHTNLLYRLYRPANVSDYVGSAEFKKKKSQATQWSIL